MIQSSRRSVFFMMPIFLRDEYLSQQDEVERVYRAVRVEVELLSCLPAAERCSTEEHTTEPHELSDLVDLFGLGAVGFCTADELAAGVYTDVLTALGVLDSADDIIVVDALLREIDHSLLAPVIRGIPRFSEVVADDELILLVRVCDGVVLPRYLDVVDVVFVLLRL